MPTDNLPQSSPKLTQAKRSLPLDAMRLKSEALALAGITKQDLADYMRKAIETTLAGMEAERTEHITYQGEITATVQHVDHQARLAAARQLAKLVQDNLSLLTDEDTEASKRQPVSVVINLGDGASAHIADAK